MWLHTLCPINHKTLLHTCQALRYISDSNRTVQKYLVLEKWLSSGGFYYVCKRTMSFLTLSFKGEIILKKHHTATSNEMAEVPRSKNTRCLHKISCIKQWYETCTPLTCSKTRRQQNLLFSTRFWICNEHKTITKSYLIVGMQAVVSVLFNSPLPKLFTGSLANFISWHLNFIVWWHRLIL